MPLRTDTQEILRITVTHFQEFDSGEEVIQHLPKKWQLQVNDLMEWECGKFHGIARIVACESAKGVSSRCSIRKES